MKRYLFTSALHSLSMVVSAGMLSCIDADEASANPQGGTISAGAATIQGQGTPVVQVNQVSDRAVIDWASFNIAPGESTRFRQPSVSSLILNRIHDQNPSQILGNISANGQVALVNPNGMVFGKGSRVDVSGLVATSADISNQSFMNSRPLSFGQPGLPDSAVVNKGTITVHDAGLAALVAPQVRNEGVIKATAGKVTLASGDTMTLDLYGDKLVSVAASDRLKRQSVTQAGRIEAAGSEVVLTTAEAAQVIDRAVNMDGWVDVGSLTEESGSIVLHAAGGDASVHGQLHADSVSAQGGRLQITGDNVRVGAGALLTATGKTGGGDIKIGGDYQGGGTTPHAKTTVIEQGAEIKANATEAGNGGRVIVWSDKRTDFAGLIQAKGGLLGGDGGFVETSSKDVLVAQGLVDASSPHGKGGEWLLDPNNITINATADTNVAGAPDFLSTDDNAVVTVASILASLNAGTNVSVTTGTAGGNSQSGDITVSSAIGKTAGGDATLTLKARNNIAVNANISSTSNKLNVTLWSDSDNSGAGGITMTNAAIASNGGNVILGGGTDPTADEAVGTVDYGVYLNNGDISTGAGNIAIRGRGEAAGAGNFGVFVHNGSVLQSTTGDISLTGTGGSGTSSDIYGVYLYGGGNITSTGAGAGAGNITLTGTGVEAGNITLTGTGGGGTQYNAGMWVYNTVTAVDGDISITGTGGSGTSSDAYGVTLYTGGVVSTTGAGAGAGNISITGTGGTAAGGNNLGFYLFSTSSVTAAGPGTITLTGTAGTATTDDIKVETGANVIGGAAAGDVTLIGNTMNFANLTASSAEDIILKPRTVATTIGVNGAAGTLNLTSTELGFLSAGGDLVIGSSNGTGAITVDAYANWSSRAGTGVRFLSDTGVISINGAQTFGARDFTLTTNADPVIAAGVTGTGDLTLETASAATTMGIAGGAGTVNYSTFHRITW